jgi:hypothetical protein
MKLRESMHVTLSLGSLCEACNIQNSMPQQADTSQTLTPLPSKQVLYTRMVAILFSITYVLRDIQPSIYKSFAKHRPLQADI